MGPEQAGVLGPAAQRQSSQAAGGDRRHLGVDGQLARPVQRGEAELHDPANRVPDRAGGARTPAQAELAGQLLGRYAGRDRLLPQPGTAT